jgi:cytochrome c oxidase subunit 4
LQDDARQICEPFADDMARPSITASLGGTLIKAVLIYWFFMHLKEEGGTVRLVAIGVIAWLAIPFLLMAADYATR